MNRALPLPLALTIALLLAPLPGRADTPEIAGTPAEAAELAVFAADFVPQAMAEADVPGLVLVVVADGEVVLAEGFGRATVDPPRPVDPETTVFRVGSVSKSLTASAILALVEEGRISLDADVGRLLAETPPETVPAEMRDDWAAMQRVVPGALRPGVTPLHLLTHTAGLDERLFGQHVTTPSDFTSLAGWFAEHPPHHFDDPGRVIAYNDQGTALAGLVLEAVTGRAFADWVEAELLVPLRMERTTFRQIELPMAVAGNLATAYTRLGGAEAPLTAYPRDHVITTPAAGLFTTGADMGRYMLALLAPEEAGIARRQLRTAATQHPELSGRAFGFAEASHEGHRVLHKDGQASGFNARLTLVPAAGVGVFSAANRSILDRGWSFNRAARIHKHLASAILGELLPEEAGKPEPAPDPLLTVATPGSPPLLPGPYRDVVASRHTLEKLLSLGNTLEVKDLGGGQVGVFGMEWKPVAPGLYGPAGEGGGNFAAGRDGEGEPRYLYVGAGAFERVAVVDTPQALATGLGGGAALGVLLALGWAAAGRRREPALRRAWGALAIAGGCLAAFTGLLAFAVLRIDPQAWFHGVPLVVRAALALPLASAAALAAATFALARAWRTGAGGMATRTFLTLGLVGLTVSLAILAHWNLLGWRF